MKQVAIFALITTTDLPQSHQNLLSSRRQLAPCPLRENRLSSNVILFSLEV